MHSVEIIVPCALYASYSTDPAPEPIDTNAAFVQQRTALSEPTSPTDDKPTDDDGYSGKPGRREAYVES